VSEVTVFYADGTVWRGQFEKAPSHNVQVLIYAEPTLDGGPAMTHQGDYFRQEEDGSVVAMDYDSLMTWLTEDLKIVKVGSMVSTSRWRTVYGMAQSWLSKMQKERRAE